MTPPRVMVAVVLLVASACATGSAPPTVETFTTSADRVAEQGSARMEMSMRMVFDPEGQRLETTVGSTGIVEFDPQRSASTMTITSSVPQPTTSECEMRTEGTVVYLRVGDQAAERQSLEGGAAPSWLRVDLSELPGFDVNAFSTDPAATLDYLRGVSRDIEDLGSEEIRGVTTRHYRATVDLQALLEATGSGNVDEAATDFVEQFGAEIFPMDVWLDDADLPRRLSFSLGGQQVAIELRMDMYDFGATDPVEIPSGEDVQAAEDFQQAMLLCTGLDPTGGF